MTMALHFVLIHGACHGAWAWYSVEDQLLKAGHKVSSMDMTGAGTSTVNPDTIATWEEYNKPALDFFQSLPEPSPDEKVVLVGHSMGGFTCQMLMERFPHKIDLAVFVTAFLTASGIPYMQDLPLLKLIENPYISLNHNDGAENPPTSFYFPKSSLPHFFYSGLDSEISVLGSKLLRPYPTRMLATPITYTKEKYGRVPAVYVKYAQDQAVTPAAQEYVVTHYGPFREVVELEGGHFDFLGRPKEFAELLAKLAVSSHRVEGEDKV